MIPFSVLVSLVHEAALEVVLLEQGAVRHCVSTIHFSQWMAATVMTGTAAELTSAASTTVAAMAVTAGIVAASTAALMADVTEESTAAAAVAVAVLA